MSSAMEVSISAATIQITQGNIAEQYDLDAVVNAANAELRIGGGVAGALHRAAGPALEKACEPLAPIKPGQAVITEAFNLPNEYVIHTLGPVYGRDEPAEELLRDCYLNAMKLAEDYQIESIGFPAISTGAFGYPLKKGARVALKTVHNYLSDQHNSLETVRFVLFSESDMEIFQTEASLLLSDNLYP